MRTGYTILLDADTDRRTLSSRQKETTSIQSRRTAYTIPREHDIINKHRSRLPRKFRRKQDSIDRPKTPKEPSKTSRVHRGQEETVRVDGEPPAPGLPLASVRVGRERAERDVAGCLRCAVHPERAEREWDLAGNVGAPPVQYGGALGARWGRWDVTALVHHEVIEVYPECRWVAGRHGWVARPCRGRCELVELVARGIWLDCETYLQYCGTAITGLIR